MYVQYYVTARCNLACEQCNIIYANADLREATTEEAGRIAENLAKAGVSVVLLTGGEPFSRRDLPEIVSAFAKQGIHVRLQTNGLASREALEACVKAGANDISISLDSLQPDVQDGLNGAVPGSWSRAIRAISYVNEIFNKNSFAALGCVISPRNLEHIPDVVRFATEIGWWVSLVPAHTTEPSRPMGFRTYDLGLQFRPDQYERLQTVLNDLRQLRNSGLNLYDSDPYLDDIFRFCTGQRVTWRDRNLGVCDSPNLYFVVLPNGNMAVCCDLRLKSELSVSDPDFIQKYRDRQLYREAKEIASNCPGCLYGSFPEISVSSRYLRPMLKRIMLFGLKGSQRHLQKRSETEILEIATEIRRKSPHLYGGVNR